MKRVRRTCSWSSMTWPSTLLFPIIRVEGSSRHQKEQGEFVLRGSIINQQQQQSQTKEATRRFLSSCNNCELKAGLMMIFVVIVMVLTALHLYAIYYNSLPKNSDGNTVKSSSCEREEEDEDAESVSAHPGTSYKADDENNEATPSNK